ncbi:MAG TPA: MerR family transcriptional regulator [bacterium]|jgi:MerR family mercuric resistance operon transcriptional regulator
MNRSKRDTFYSIGQIAKISGVNPGAIRYYEKYGLISKPSRSKSGYRMFNTVALEEIKFIKSSREIGFTLDEIRELMELGSNESGDCAEIRKKAQGKLDEVRIRLDMLRELEARLGNLIGKCNSQNLVSDCPILEALQSGARI